MDTHEPKKMVAIRIPTSTLKRIKKGRRQVNVSAEIRRLIDIGLKLEETN